MKILDSHHLTSETAVLGNKNVDLANKILSEFMAIRRLPKGTPLCEGAFCEKCSSFHFQKILSSIQNSRPISFVLPAFPGKSPNREKVLSHLPDYAEQLALTFLGNLCRRIKEYYEPGIKITICSDGRVFSDIVGMEESDVTAYREALHQMIKALSLTDILTFDLDDFYRGDHFLQMREKLMESYGQSLESLKEKVKRGAKEGALSEEIEANRIYCGMTRFLFEDSLYPEQEKGRTLLQKEARMKAYEVIRRSNAWSDLIEELFPQAVRLSIHPQTCGAKKLGIRLIGEENWMTPWHGVILQTASGPRLLKRFEAKALGAELVYSREGHPSHYTLEGANK